jgi:hypothetical protein
MINMSSKLFLGLLFVLQVIGSGYSAINWDDVDLNRGRADYNPAASCRQILDLAGPLADMVQNGYYYFQTKRDDVKQMYCNMVDERCGVKGWMRVAKVNASTGVCPENFKIDYAHCQLKVCRGNKTSPELSRGRLYTMTFPINIPFTRVAAFVEGHQFGSPDAFNRRNTRGGLDGITFSYGNSRTQHLLWVYAAGVADKKDRADCPCSTVSGDAAPSRYGRFHYCDTGNSGRTSQNRWFTEKVLWSGEGCPATSTCCDATDLPYFCRSHLQNSRNTDRFVISTRLNDPASIEDIGITKLEIYVA